jgi:HAD superfamily hydrolase (TIGR01490 family)
MEAAFFDLDKTVIAKASMVAFGGPLRRAGMINRRLMARAVWSGLVFHYLGADEHRMRRFRESALRVTRGWERDTIATLVAETLTDVIDPIVYAEALELIRDHRAAGRLVFLVSASPEEIVRPLGVYLGVDRVIASRARLDDLGRYTGEVEFYAYGPYKAEAVEEVAEELQLDLAACYAYSDSITDVPLLRTVGNPVVVNPDRDLARVARAEGWPVLNFRHGVPLRERVPLPPPGRLAMGAAIAGGVAAGGLLGWWIVARRPGPGARLRRPGAS